MPDYGVLFYFTYNPDYGYYVELAEVTAVYSRFYIDHIPTLKEHLKNSVAPFIMDNGGSPGKWSAKVIETTVPVAKDTLYIGLKFIDLEMQP